MIEVKPGFKVWIGTSNVPKVSKEFADKRIFKDRFVETGETDDKGHLTPEEIKMIMESFGGNGNG